MIPRENNFRRMVHAPTPEEILSTDLLIPLFIPLELVAHFNTMFENIEKEYGTRIPRLTTILEGVNKYKESLVLWRINSDTMWQKMDRKLDE